MSALDAGLPGSGTLVKSIQRGIAAPGTVTISPVNTRKTELRWLGSSNDVIFSSSSTISLTNSNTITISAGGTAVSWELTEFQ